MRVTIILASTYASLVTFVAFVSGCDQSDGRFLGASDASEVREEFRPLLAIFSEESTYLDIVFVRGHSPVDDGEIVLRFLDRDGNDMEESIGVSANWLSDKKFTDDINQRGGSGFVVLRINGLPTAPFSRVVFSIHRGDTTFEFEVDLPPGFA